MRQFLGQEKAAIYGWTDGVQIEEAAMQQLRNVASLPFIHHHIAVMPDVHWGCGATVGSVIPTLNVIIPAAVGVDIGCGMMAVKLPLHAKDLPDNLHALRTSIEAAVPHGRTDNGGVNDVGAYSAPSGIGRAYFEGYTDQKDSLAHRLEKIIAVHPKLTQAAQRAPFHMGTLGTGNHFIELCLDESGAVWVMLHSGSRGIGNKIGTYFIEKAKEDMRRYHINLPDADLAYIPNGSPVFHDYMLALHWAQEFAAANRKTMMSQVLDVIRRHFPLHSIPADATECEMAVNCHHNYVNEEKHYGQKVWLTRKGAVRAREGDLGIIPGSMGAKSFIVRGKGNHESFNSCSHGAGRVMSRTRAQKEITLEQHEADTAGVECRKDASVIDESPRAYKDIDAVMRAQADLVDIVHTLKQILCVKG